MYQRDPYRPATSFSMFPPVIKNLLIINGLIFLAQMTPVLGPVIMKWLALYPISVPDLIMTPSGPRRLVTEPFGPWQLVTYGFLHGGFMHLFFNMFALWMFGMQVEYSMGSKRFLTYYLICVAGAGITQLVVVQLTGGFQPTVGASGAVFGLLMAFGLFYPEQPIYLYFLFPIKAKWFVLIFGAFELYYGVSSSQPGVANFAHLGGMVFGYVLIQFWRGRLPMKPTQRMYV